MNKNRTSEKNCRWCKSLINSDALLCKECNKWPSTTKNWIDPANFLSILGALAAWAAVAVQLSPEPTNPTLTAAKAVETFEHNFSQKCIDTENRNCFYEFWIQYADAWTAIEKVEKLGDRNELFSRINKIRNNSIHNYKEPNSESGNGKT